MTRKKISIVRLLETPQAQEAMAKAVVDHRNSFTSPTRLASQPVIGMEMALATPNEVMTGSLAQRRAKVAGNGRDRHVGDSGIQHLHERRERQRNGHNDQLRAFQRFLLLHYTHPELSGVGLNDLVYQLINRIESDFTGIALVNRGAPHLAGQHFTIAIGGVDFHQRREADAQRVFR